MQTNERMNGRMNDWMDEWNEPSCLVARRAYHLASSVPFFKHKNERGERKK